MDKRLKEKLQKKFICFYLQRKRNELRSRRNLVWFLELKLKNKQRLIKTCLELFVQYLNIYHQLKNLHDGGHIRSCRRHYRNVGWWNTVNNLYNKERFKQVFRISRNTFHYILQKVGTAILKEDAGVGSISPDKRLAITLYKLGRGDYNYTIGEMTGYAESTLSCLIKEVCQAIVKILWEEMLQSCFQNAKRTFVKLLSIWNQSGNWSLLLLQLTVHTYQ